MEEFNSEVEKLFCKIFADILSVEKIGATDNFFELGGIWIGATGAPMFECWRHGGADV